MDQTIFKNKECNYLFNCSWNVVACNWLVFVGVTSLVDTKQCIACCLHRHIRVAHEVLMLHPHFKICSSSFETKGSLIDLLLESQQHFLKDETSHDRLGSNLVGLVSKRYTASCRKSTKNIFFKSYISWRKCT